MELLSRSRGIIPTLGKKVNRLRLITLSLALTAISVCAAGQTNDFQPNGVTIAYTNEINGYSVSVLWKPLVVRNNRTIGPAILEFYKIDEPYSFYLTNNHFGLENSMLPFSYSEDNLSIVSINEYEINLEYNEDDLATMALRLYWNIKLRERFSIHCMATCARKIYKVWNWDKFFELGKNFVR